MFQEQGDLHHQHTYVTKISLDSSCRSWFLVFSFGSFGFLFRLCYCRALYFIWIFLNWSTTESDCTVVLQQKCDNATLITFISTTTTTTLHYNIQYVAYNTAVISVLTAAMWRISIQLLLSRTARIQLNRRVLSRSGGSSGNCLRIIIIICSSSRQREREREGVSKQELVWSMRACVRVLQCRPRPLSTRVVPAVVENSRCPACRE